MTENVIGKNNNKDYNYIGCRWRRFKIISNQIKDCVDIIVFYILKNLSD